MAFPASFLDEVRSRIRLSELVGRKVKLVRKGKEHLGLCPFHSEKTPSFTVNDDKAFYHCFGCGAHGSAFDFLIETEGLNFPEAVERAAGMAGVEVPQTTRAEAESARRASTLHEVMEKAAAWFADQLSASGGKAARDYLDGRGLSEKVIMDFRLGLAPERRTSLRDALRGEDVSEAQMIEAGLIIRPEDGGETYDRFRNRIMFPITDPRGRVIAFGGRALGEARAKYLNSPETPLFRKGRVLYGLHEARTAIRETGTAVVVEGYLDVIALHAAGIGSAVAPLGTALTEDQMGLLWRHAPEPILCLDGDAAGRRAAESAAERALALLTPGHSLRFAQVPVGEDPDSLIQAQGVGALRSVLRQAMGLDDLLWARERGRERILSPEREAGLRRRLDELARQIRDEDVRAAYQRRFRARFAAEFPEAGAGRGRRGPGKSAPQRGRPPAAKPTRELLNSALARVESGSGLREQALSALVIEHPELLSRVEEEYSHIDFPAGPLEALRAAIIREAARIPGLDRATLKNHLQQQGFGGLLDRLAAGASRMAVRPGATLDQIETIWRDALAQHQRGALMSHIESAGRDYAADPSDEKRRRIQDLQEELASAQGMKTTGNLLNPA